jgi:hypothetical protein
VKRPRTFVTDHAVVRYLERVQGYGIDALRIAIGRRVEEAVALGASAVTIEGFTYVLNTDATGHPIVATVLHRCDTDYIPGRREMKARRKERG